MLHLYFGSDTGKARSAALAAIETAVVAGAQLQRFEPDSYESGSLAHASAATSLFGDRMVYLIDSPTVEPLFYDELGAVLETCAAHDSLFVVVDGELRAAEKKRLTQHASVCEEFTRNKEPAFNTFALADALAKRDKRSLWIGLQEAWQAGKGNEEIIGILWWQLKSIRLAALTTSATEAGMKSFPYQKAKRALTLYSVPEVEALSRSLLAVYHGGHAGTRDLPLALEQWVLRL